MSGISTGVGLISGLDYQSLIDQLMQVESRPRDLLLSRIGNIDAQSTAYLDISARITAVLSRIERLAMPSTFRAAAATSSLPDTLSVSADPGAALGSYSFVVRALATTHQAVSRGFYDPTAPMSGGTLRLESAQARVNRDTQLSELNGSAGVYRGAFKIVDALGQEATIDTTDKLTLGEVLDAINESGLAVRAEVRDDALVLTDTSTGGTETLRVQELHGGRTAESLGFGAGHKYDSDGDGELVGSDVIFLAGTSALSSLNDGLGLRASLGGGDFKLKIGDQQIQVNLADVLKPSTKLAQLNHGQGVRLGEVRITSRDGVFRDVDLSNAETIQDVKNAIEGAFDDGRISVVLSGSRLLLTDSTDVDDDETPRQFKIADRSGHAAQDLGLAGSSSTSQIQGRDVLHMDTLVDVINAINLANGNEGDDKQPLVVASIASDGKRLLLESQVAGALTIEASDSTTSHALEDLGFAAGTYYDIGGGASVTGHRIVGGLDTVLLKTLNGGDGFDAGTIRINTADGSTDVDLAGADTLADVVTLMNEAAESAGLDIRVGYDNTRTRLLINNTDGSTSPITISDVSGDFAAATGLAQTGYELRSDNLQRRYVSENTLLDDLNAGRGVSRGSFKITNSQGSYATINLSYGEDLTMQDVIERINNAGINVEARINDTGDGLLIIDRSGGNGKLTVEDEGGSTARDLNLRGESESGRLDGSFEYELELSGGDSLESLAARISDETTLANATIMNDGSATAPYRLSITSRVSGALGDLIIDDTDSNLGIATLTQAQDARVLFGNNSSTGILLSSNDNTFENVVDGVTLTAHNISDEAVSVTIERDLAALTEAMNGLVKDYNAAITRIDEVSDYDPDTQEAGVLLGEGTLQMVDNRLHQMFARSRDTLGAFDRFSEVGIIFSEGGKLTFDEDKFQAAFEADPEGVLNFFTNENYGVATQLKDEIDSITGADGLIQRQTDTLGDQKELLEDRIDYMNELLERKRARLLRQFQAMESSLSMMQSQQAALANLGSMAQSAGTGLSLG